ncbi:MAG: iron-containing alcohol dehydrogenase [Spirochaetaceae bacterium]|nr:iron-containing alcohol dehydrogenase [Spirochaetaceae bacterium]
MDIDIFKNSFQASVIPALFFGEGSLSSLEKIITPYKEKSGALFTGKSFFKNSIYFEKISNIFKEKNIKIITIEIPGEPSPDNIDNAVKEMRSNNVSFVVAIGGGSVVDAGKAASIMAMQDEGIKEYLEGVGTKALKGTKLPFIAVPTTSGTGSEATKNSVISEVGDNGFKKSLRHDIMVSDYTIIDPALLVLCPPTVTAWSGMDAVTQLIESYVSTKATIFTDSLAAPALEIAGKALPLAFSDGNNKQARSGMAWAAYVSGITLANAGLGVVHGVASPAGGYINVPHGVICGTLIANATRYIIDKLFKADPKSEGLKKYAQASMLLTGKEYGNIKDSCNALVDLLTKWTLDFNIPLLKNYGFDEALVRKTAKISDGKNSPVKLDNDDIFKIIMERV